MSILDMHTHILPGADDGAQNLEDTVNLLTMLKNQGVTDVVATPHFSPMSDSIEEFNSNIKRACDELEKIKDMDLPKVYLGREVLYFYGLGSLEGANELTFNGSEFILIEFGHLKFDDQILSDIVKIRKNLELVPIIAHIERYKDFSGYKKLLGLVKDGICKAQVNSASVVEGRFYRTAHKLIKNGLVQYIGSDCHSVANRPPRIDEAYRVINKKYGKSTAYRFMRYSEILLEKIKENGR